MTYWFLVVADSICFQIDEFHALCRSFCTVPRLLIRRKNGSAVETRASTLPAAACKYNSYPGTLKKVIFQKGLTKIMHLHTQIYLFRSCSMFINVLYISKGMIFHFLLRSLMHLIQAQKIKIENSFQKRKCSTRQQQQGCRFEYLVLISNPFPR